MVLPFTKLSIELGNSVNLLLGQCDMRNAPKQQKALRTTEREG